MSCSAALQVVMFDIQQRTTLGELSTPFIKYVVWSADMNHVALLSKHAIIIANKKLGNSSTGTLLLIRMQPLCLNTCRTRLDCKQNKASQFELQFCNTNAPSGGLVSMLACLIK